MFTKRNLFFIFCAFLRLVRMEECTTQNITCKDIRTPDGFKYELLPKNRGPELEREISHNGTTICTGKVGHLNCSSEVVRHDRDSITTKTCNNLKLKSYHEEQGGFISESCQVFNITVPEKTTVVESRGDSEKQNNNSNKDSHSSTGCGRTCIGIVIACVLLAVAACALFWFLCRKSRKGNGRGAYVPCLGNRKWKSDTQVDNSVEQNDRNFRQELSQESGDAMSKSVTAEVRISMDADNTITNDDVPRVNGVAAQNGLNGNMRHDPGGGKDKEQHGNGNLQSCGQRTLEKKGFNCHTDNDCLSSCNQGSAREEAIGETAVDEGQALVDSSGSGRESLTPPHDVETGTHCEEKTLLNNG